MPSTSYGRMQLPSQSRSRLCVGATAKRRDIAKTPDLAILFSFSIGNRLLVPPRGIALSFPNSKRAPDDRLALMPPFIIAPGRCRMHQDRFVPPPGAFTRSVPIRFSDCDPAGIVYFPHYFDIFNGLIEDWYSCWSWGTPTPK